MFELEGFGKSKEGTSTRVSLRGFCNSLVGGIILIQIVMVGVRMLEGSEELLDWDLLRYLRGIRLVWEFYFCKRDKEKKELLKEKKESRRVSKEVRVFKWNE